MKGLFLALFTVFLNLSGVAIAFAFMQTLIFDPVQGLILTEMTDEMRGFLFGLMVASYTFMPFLFSPLIGSLSDQLGRKRLLLPTLALNAFSFCLSGIAVLIQSWPLFLVSRILAGIASGNTPVAQAVIADISTPKTMRKNFGLVSVAFGLGFTLSPFIGGLLAFYSLALPFFVFSVVSFLSFLYTGFFFRETFTPKGNEPINILKGFSDLKKVLRIPSLSAFFSSMVILFFGWEIFFPFASLFLKERFGFTVAEVSLFYGVSGLLFGVGGLLLRVLHRVPLHRTLQLAIFIFGVLLAGLSQIYDPRFFWIYLIPLMAVTPTFFSGALSYVSGFSDEGHQGEMLGIYNSFQQFSLTFPPLIIGPLLPSHPTLVVTGAAFCTLLATIPALFLKRQQVLPTS